MYASQPYALSKPVKNSNWEYVFHWHNYYKLEEGFNLMGYPYMQNIQGISKKLIGEGFRIEDIILNIELPEKLS